MKQKMQYVTCCVGYPHKKVQDLHDMIDVSKGITYQTFKKYVNIYQVSRKMGYAMDSRLGLTIKGDWHIAYYKSSFCGKPCVYMVHSGIEYIYQ